MEDKFREYMKNNPHPKTGRIAKAATINNYCSRLRLSRVSNYPEIQEELTELEITSVFDITNVEQYQRIEPLLLLLCDRIKADKMKKGDKSPTLLLDSARSAYERFLESIKDPESVQEPEEVESNDGYIEGERKLTASKRYERDPRARRECVEHHGYKCKVCGFDFEQAYGEIGKAFIHVHHIEPLANAEGKRETNPVKDLVPVCPNCHAMLHRKTPPLTIAKLKEMKKC